VPRSTQAAGRIALVRHGRSALVQTGWIDVAGVRQWRTAYEAAGISAGERAPVEIEQLAQAAQLVLSSDAPRAVASARLLAPGREIVASPLLRELDLEAPSLGRLRLPLAAWAVAIGTRALLLRLRGRYPAEAEAARVGEAVAWLTELAGAGSLIVAVTHASVRGQLAPRLVQAGWRAETGRRSLRPWSAWTFTRSGPNPGPRQAT
jgi:hypothetical protein